MINYNSKNLTNSNFTHIYNFVHQILLSLYRYATYSRFLQENYDSKFTPTDLEVMSSLYPQTSNLVTECYLYTKRIVKLRLAVGTRSAKSLLVVRVTRRGRRESSCRDPTRYLHQIYCSLVTNISDCVLRLQFNFRKIFL